MEKNDDRTSFGGNCCDAHNACKMIRKAKDYIVQRQPRQRTFAMEGDCPYGARRPRHVPGLRRRAEKRHGDSPV